MDNLQFSMLSDAFRHEQINSNQALNRYDTGLHSQCDQHAGVLTGQSVATGAPVRATPGRHHPAVPWGRHRCRSHLPSSSRGGWAPSSGLAGDDTDYASVCPRSSIHRRCRQVSIPRISLPNQPNSGTHASDEKGQKQYVQHRLHHYLFKALVTSQNY